MANLARADVLAKAGYAARGVVYGLLGWLALETRGKADEGQNAVFDMVQDMPAGGVVLTLLVLGLVAYGVYKLASALFDLERHGTEPKGLAARAGAAAGAVAYLAMAYAASKFALGYRNYASEGAHGGADMAGGVLAWPLGWVLVGLAGAAFVAASLFQVVGAATGNFMKRMAPDAPRATEVFGRLGFAARAVVFALVGWSLLRSAWLVRKAEVRDLGGVLAQLRDNGTLYLAVAAGLLLFGLFSLICSRYRVVAAVDVVHATRRRFN